jgi:hypothetical protein
MSFTHIPDSEQRLVVQGYCEFIRDKVILPFKTGAVKAEFWVEEKVTIIPDVVFGTADFVGVRETPSGSTDLILVDLKTGFGDVHVVDNPQFLSYCIGACNAHSVTGNIIIIGYLPRVESREVPWEKWVISVAELQERKEKLTAAATLAHAILEGKQEPVYVPGDHCRYCTAKGICRAFNKDLDDKVDGLLSSAPITNTLPDPHSLDIEWRLKFLSVWSKIKEFGDSVYEITLAEAVAGKDTPGWKVVEGTRRRKWNPDLSVEEVAGHLKELGVREPTESKLITIGEVEKIVGKGKLAELTQLGDATEILVPESDKRVASKKVDNLLTDLK